MILSPARTDDSKKPLPLKVWWVVKVAEPTVVYAADGRRLFDAEAPNRAKHVVDLHNASLNK